MRIRRIRLGLLAVGVAWLALSACADEGEFVAEPVVDDLGVICGTHADCAYVCTGGVPGAPSHCTRSCAEEACPAGYYCVSRELTGLVCAMGYCSEDGGCPDSYSCNTEEHACQHAVIPCTADVDCPAATACNQGSCATTCYSGDDCKQGYVCNHEHNCVQCQHAGDCTGGYACVAGACNTACVESADCARGHHCDHGACLVIEGGGLGQVGEYCDYNDHEACQYFCDHNALCNQVCDPANDVCPEGWSCSDQHLVCQQDH